MAGLIREDIRKFCRTRCRKEHGYRSHKKSFTDWRNEGRSLAWSDPEVELIDRAPEGAAFYVLTCTDVLGILRSFPAVGGFSLRRFELPQVPIKGRYRLTFLDSDKDELKEGGSIAIGRATKGLRVPDGGRNRFRSA